MTQMINRCVQASAIVAMCCAYPALAQQSSQPTFQSTAEASQSLFQAVQSNNEEAIAKILGGQSDLTSSRDPGQDKADREMFVQKFQEMHRLHREPDGTVVLYIGAENWPFPLPLVEKNGAWRFDSDAGQKEVLFRRIGENELNAMGMCHDLANPNASTQAESPRGDSTPIHGYYFRRLTAGPKSTAAFIAYPAEYRSSGVLTFVITGNGVVYEKDLGANTTALATAMTTFHKDATWRAADQ